MKNAVADGSQVSHPLGFFNVNLNLGTRAFSCLPPIKCGREKDNKRAQNLPKDTARGEAQFPGPSRVRDVTAARGGLELV